MHKKRLTKEMLYQRLIEKGFCLPKMTSTICNMNFLFRVMENKEYCPLKPKNDNEPKVCNIPPKKMILLEIIQDELQK
jgi:hypothetical protein